MKKRLTNGFIALGVLCIAFIVDFAIRGPRARTHQEFIVEALRSIPDVSDASVTGVWSGYKTSNGSVNRHLVSGLSTSEVRRFYVDGLEQRGWKIACERLIGDRDRIVFTANNEDTVVVDLPKQDSQITGEYSVQVSWGISYC
jgi:hypothetical protein